MAGVRFPSPAELGPQLLEALAHSQEKYQAPEWPRIVRAMARCPHVFEAHQRAFRWPFGPGELSRPTKELLAACVSAVNACHY